MTKGLHGEQGRGSPVSHQRRPACDQGSSSPERWRGHCRLSQSGRTGGTRHVGLGQGLCWGTPAEAQICRKAAAMPESAGDTSSPARQLKMWPQQLRPPGSELLAGPSVICVLEFPFVTATSRPTSRAQAGTGRYRQVRAGVGRGGQTAPLPALWGSRHAPAATEPPGSASHGSGGPAASW